MLKRSAYYFVSLLLAVSVTGCSLFVPHTQKITISGQPANANVVVNGQHLTSPATVLVKRNKSVHIVVSKEGYNTFVTQCGHSLGTWGTLDVIGGVCFLFPFLGLLSPGAHEVDQENFYYVLTPEKH